MKREYSTELAVRNSKAPVDNKSAEDVLSGSGSDDDSVQSAPVMTLQRSNQGFSPALGTFTTIEINELEKAWSKEKSGKTYNESDIIFAEFDYFKNLQNPNRDTLAEYIAKFRLITDNNYKFNKCTCGTFCCRNQAREYRNSLSIIEILLDILIFPLFLIIFLVLWIIWIIEMIFLYIAIHYTCFVCCCIDPFKINDTELKTVDKCVFTKRPSLISFYDFAIHRLPSYYYTMTFKMGFNWVHYITGGFKYNPLIDDDLMYFMLTMGPISREVNIISNPNTGEHEIIELDLHPNTSLPKPYATEITLFPGHALVAKGCGWDIKNKKTWITVLDKDGKDLKVFNEKNNEESVRLWKLAKAHLQCTVTWYTAAWTHNWVHFHLLDICAKCYKEIVPDESVLGHLLDAHLRFTSTINNAGIGGAIHQPMGTYSKFTDRIVPYKVMPVAPQQFMFKVAQNCANYYLDIDSTNGKVKNIQTSQFPPKWVKERINSTYAYESGSESAVSVDFQYQERKPQTQDDEKKTGLNDTDDVNPDHSFGPKPNINIDIRGLIPYLDMCSDYYVVIKRFIDNLWLNDIAHNNHFESLLEKDMVYQFIQHIEANGLPGISQVEPQAVLATIIWTAGVIHTADHLLYAKVFNTYGFFASLQAWDGKYDAWTDILQGSFKRHQWKAFQTKCFLDMFVHYRKSWFFARDTLTDEKLYRNFQNVPDKKRKKRANKIHQLFLQDLDKVNQQWRWMVNVKDLAASTCF